MPIEVDLKRAQTLLYDEKKPQDALELYDAILEQSPENFTAHIYKAACLEKLYYGFKSWHNEATLQNALELLDKAVEIAEKRGDRSKLGFATFRLFVHHYNRKNYPLSKHLFDSARKLGYKDDTIGIWEANLNSKIEKWERKHGPKKISEVAPTTTASPTPAKSDSSKPDVMPLKVDKPAFKADWYQSATSLTISLFTTSLPSSRESVNAKISADLRNLEVSYPVSQTGSEFQYSTRLSHEVDPEDIGINVLTKKIEITLKKKQKAQWKRLDDPAETLTARAPVPTSSPANEAAHSYPSSSKKSTDWSKFEVDDEEQNQSADAFFQQLYSRADPDTQRAMMKSMVESNGTALNTNWEEVAKKTVEMTPPEGSEPKKW
ncbi:LAFA_0D15830g1_1 [Lachancea sp. 'fantastica']|nr:LAFA_0D15830g1_1 [Lachancea sp. 'fantastica']